MVFRSIVINATSKHTATAIILHGFGATASDWTILAQACQLPHVRWIFPQGPTRPITVYQKELVPSWFDILTSGHENRNKDGSEDEAGMAASMLDLELIIAAEKKEGIEEKRIVVGGFSQGAGLSLIMGARREGKLGGILSMSGYMPLSWKTKVMKHLDLPVFWSHGSSDQVINIEVARKATKLMVENGMTNLEYREYPGMGHSYCDSELEDIENWLHKVIPALESKI